MFRNVGIALVCIFVTTLATLGTFILALFNLSVYCKLCTLHSYSDKKLGEVA
jgi:hypothetical protein